MLTGIRVPIGTRMVRDGRLNFPVCSFANCLLFSLFIAQKAAFALWSNHRGHPTNTGLGPPCLEKHCITNLQKFMGNCLSEVSLAPVKKGNLHTVLGSINHRNHQIFLNLCTIISKIKVLIERNKTFLLNTRTICAGYWHFCFHCFFLAKSCLRFHYDGIFKHF